MATHTPGPWEWLNDNEIWGDKEGVLRLSHYGWDGGADIECEPADRALIVAAPELLALLKECVAECDCVAYGLDGERCCHGRARAAIARLEGA